MCFGDFSEAVCLGCESAGEGKCNSVKVVSDEVMKTLNVGRESSVSEWEIMTCWTRGYSDRRVQNVGDQTSRGGQRRG